MSSHLGKDRRDSCVVQRYRCMATTNNPELSSQQEGSDRTPTLSDIIVRFDYEYSLT